MARTAVSFVTPWIAGSTIWLHDAKGERRFRVERQRRLPAVYAGRQSFCYRCRRSALVGTNRSREVGQRTWAPVIPSPCAGFHA